MEKNITCIINCNSCNKTYLRNMVYFRYIIIIPCIKVMMMIIIIVVILVFTFTQGIYNYIPETDHVSRVHSVPAVMYLQFVLHVMLFHPRNMFCTFTVALSVVCVQSLIWLFFAVP